MIAPKIGRGTKMHVHSAACGLNRGMRAYRWPRRVLRIAHNRSLESGFPGYVIRGRARRGSGCVSLLRPNRRRKKDGYCDCGTANDVANFMLQNLLPLRFHSRATRSYLLTKRETLRSNKLLACVIALRCLRANKRRRPSCDVTVLMNAALSVVRSGGNSVTESGQIGACWNKGLYLTARLSQARQSAGCSRQ
jgi:hypothetical protein